MHRFEFSSEEVEILREMLDASLKDIELEISHTATHDYKNMLKRRKEILAHLMEKLSTVLLEL